MLCNGISIVFKTTIWDRIYAHFSFKSNFYQWLSCFLKLNHLSYRYDVDSIHSIRQALFLFSLPEQLTETSSYRFYNLWCDWTRSFTILKVNTPIVIYLPIYYIYKRDMQLFLRNMFILIYVLVLIESTDVILNQNY